MIEGLERLVISVARLDRYAGRDSGGDRLFGLARDRDDGDRNSQAVLYQRLQVRASDIRALI